MSGSGGALRRCRPKSKDSLVSSALCVSHADAMLLFPGVVRGGDCPPPQCARIGSRRSRARQHPLSPALSKAGRLDRIRHWYRVGYFASRKAASTTKPRVIVHDVSERVPIPLALHHHPLAVSFAIFDKAHMASAVVSGVGGKTSTAATTAPQEGGDELEDIIILVDPTPLETTLCTSKMYVVANVQGEICVLDKAGGRPLGEGVLQRVTEIARRRVKELAAVMEAELQRDARDRVLEVR
ncbi:hypothetical protein L7F22_033334 [Adiantum nelumboides]|nr:hypothetical protein [Adiantum nelumboides]